MRKFIIAVASLLLTFGVAAKTPFSEGHLNRLGQTMKLC
jgi:hypothetical protein